MAAGLVGRPVISSTTSLTPRTEVVVTRLAGGEGVLLDTAAGRYIRLNKTAMAIWTAIEHGAPVDTIIRRLTEEFDVSGEAAERAVRRFAAELLRENLVSVDPTGRAVG